MNRIDLIPSTIIAACTLHNICLLDDDNEVEGYILEGGQYINNEEGNIEVQRLDLPVIQEGEAKRNYLATVVNN